MLQVKAGEVQKLGLLYEQHKKALYGFFYKMSHSHTLSENLVQIVFTKILQSKHTLVGDGKFITWMFYTVQNKVLNALLPGNYELHVIDSSSKTAELNFTVNI